MLRTFTLDNDGDKFLVRIPGQCDLPFEGQGQNFCIVGRGSLTGGLVPVAGSRSVPWIHYQRESRPAGVCY